MANPDLTSLDALRNLVDYSPATGLFTWRARPASTFGEGRYAPEKVAAIWNARHAGKAAGRLNQEGYVELRISKSSCRAHRAAWALYYGEWPDGEIDHINHDRSDNRISNLREVDTRQNALNQSRPKNNVSGVVGVCWSSRKSRWTAHIMVHKKQQHLGTFIDFDAAVRARKAAEARYGFHANHGDARPQVKPYPWF